jgi:uncharacterized protein YbjT (DUF2867 family)
MTHPLIAVTGATGLVGGKVASLLAERDVRQRLIVRDPSRAPQLGGAVEVRQIADYGAREDMQRALEGVDTLLLVPAREHPERVRQHSTAVDAAVAAGVRRIVYISSLDAAPQAVFTLARQHWATEQHVRASGVPAWTFLRMSLYLDFIPSMVSPQGVIAGPAGDGRLGTVLREDLARAAVAVLTGDGHDGRTYDITGRESFTMAEAAERMSRLTGKHIIYRNETLEEAYASRAVYGAPDWEVEGWVSSYQGIAAGELAAVSDDVRHLTGQEPGNLDEYLSAHPEALDHVRSQ